jgi:succinate dehydrogenase / fumarate reductase, cytochrome b subunit
MLMAKSISIYNSSIGQKIISALTGLFLCAFLVVHVSGNLLLFKNDGGRAFNQYAAGTSSSWLIRGLEIVLFGGFLIHIYWGIRLWFYNHRARPKDYVQNHPSENSSLFSRIMLISGSVVLLFLVVHLKTFWVPMRFAVEGQEISHFDIVKTAFENPVYDGFYIVCLTLLAFHLRQGFQSAFQTFGIRPVWRRTVDLAAMLFWLIIPLGFAALPLFFLFAKGGRS